MKKLAVFLTLILVCISPLASAGESVNDIIEEAGRHLYSSRQRALFILESAVKDYPESVELWEELINALDVDGKYFFAERASRTALKIRPDSPALLIARARILEPSAALEVLAQLQKLPAYGEESQLRMEMARLGLRGPKEPVRSVKPSIQWIDRLIANGRYEGALSIINRSLCMDAQDKHALARKAVALAMMDEFEACMKVHADSGFMQVDAYSWEIPFHGLADCLTMKQQWQKVIESFDGVRPKDRRHRMNLGLALVMTGKDEQARNVLAEAGVLGELLVLEFVRKRGSDEEAALLEKKIFEQLRPAAIRPLYPITKIFPADHPVLKALRSAIRNLCERYPEKKQLITLCFGDIESSTQKDLRRYEVVPITERITVLKRKIKAAANADEKRQLARQLCDAYASDQKYEQAVEIVAPYVRLPASQFEREKGRINPDAVKWSILKRRIDAEDLHRRNPSLLALVRFLLANIKGAEWNYPKLEGRDWLTSEQVVAKLSKIGTGVLSSVFDQFGMNTISGQNRSTYVQVVRNIGGVQDAPVLIDVLSLVVQADMEHGPNYDTPKRQATEKAIHQCLEKLTGLRNTAASRKARVLFWSGWWQANADKIVSETG